MSLMYFGFILAFLGSIDSQETTQSLVFFDTVDCNFTSSATFSEKVTNTQGTLQPPSGVTISSILVNGMWRLSICQDDTGSCQDYLEHSLFTQKCLELLEASTTIGYTRFGDSSQNRSDVLYLFSNEDFTGSKIEVPHSGFEVKELTAKSFYFTGSWNSWSVYEGPVYSGDMKCIEPSESVKENGYGFTYSLSVDINGLSAKISQCQNDFEEASTTTPGKETDVPTEPSPSSTKVTVSSTSSGTTETVVTTQDPSSSLGTTGTEIMTTEHSPTTSELTSEPSTTISIEVTSTWSTGTTSDDIPMTTTFHRGASACLQKSNYQLLLSLIALSTVNLSSLRSS